MANTKKKVTPIEEDEVLSSDLNEEKKDVEEEAPAKKVAKPNPPTPKKYAPDELIECRSVTAGQLVHSGIKSKLFYEWTDYGDIVYVEYQDLQALQSKKSDYLVKPLFIIEDEELVNQWSGILKPVYDKIKNRDIEDLFKLSPAKIKTVVANFPDGMKEAVKTRAAVMIRDGELYDIRVAKAIDEVLNTDLVEQMALR